jgi:hypothetical protein
VNQEAVAKRIEHGRAMGWSFDYDHEATPGVPRPYVIAPDGSGRMNAELFRFHTLRPDEMQACLDAVGWPKDGE